MLALILGDNWSVAGVLIVPSDISELTWQGTAVAIDGTGSAVQNASGNNALAWLTSVGSGALLAVFDGASLTIAQGLTSQGVVDVGSGSGGSLTVSGAYAQASGATTNMSVGSLRATSVSVQSGSTLQGNGTVASSITNNGNVEPQGSLPVTGNYTQTGGGALTEQFGSTLHVNLNATLSGALHVTVNPKHPPAVGRHLHRPGVRLDQRIVYEPHGGVHADNQRKQHHREKATNVRGATEFCYKTSS